MLHWLCDIVIGERGILPTSLKKIGNYAFCGCSSLKSVEIPDNVTTIGDCAFKNCSNLEHVTLPANSASMGEDVFYGCDKLQISVHSSSQPQHLAAAAHNVRQLAVARCAQRAHESWRLCARN